MSHGNYAIVQATAENGGLEWILESAKREGWEPGLHDLNTYSKVDPNGFFVGVLDGKIVGCVSAVAFDDSYGYMGYYIVDPGERGKGFGLKLFQQGMKYLGLRNIGLHGLLVQVNKYEKSGFKAYHNHARYKGSAVSATGMNPSPNIVTLGGVNPVDMAEFDRKYFPVPRKVWIEEWASIPGAVPAVYVEDGKVKGFGIMRPCVSGYRLAPLYADSIDIATQLLGYLRSQLPEGAVFFLDIPTSNLNWRRMLTEEFGMTYQWECTLMYTKGLPTDVDYTSLYGWSSLELG